MSRPILQKITGILTAAVLCAISVPAGLTASAEADITKDPTAINVLVDETPPDKLYTLAYLSLITSSYLSLGTPDTFLTLQNRLILDADNSGKIEMTDAYLFLSWDSYYRLTSTYKPETEDYLARWNTIVVTETTAPSETTVTTVSSSSAALETESTTAASTPQLSESTSETAAQSTVSSDILATQTVAATSADTSSSTDTTTTTTASTTTSAVTTTTKATTTAVTAAKSVYDGIDVSKYQGNVDWNKVKASGKDFAIIRAGYGKYASQEDPYFDQNMKNAKAAGVACGAYWFSYAESVADAKKEAEVFASVISGYQFEYPLVFDIEASVHTKMTKEQVSAIITAFCDTMESKGYYVSLYSYASFLNSYVYDSVLEKYDIWVAHFNVSAPSYSKSSYGMWQYTSTGSVSGITGDVDLDYSYKNYPSIVKKAQLNGY